MKKRKCPWWKKCAYGGAVGLFLLNTFPSSVLAADEKSWSTISLGASEGDAANAFAKPLGLLITAIQVIGFVVIVYGFYDVISSFINNNGEVKMKAVATIVVGVIMSSMKSVLQQSGIIQ